MEGKRIYTASSLYEFISKVFARLILVIVIIIAFTHYNENPVVIIILSVLCFLGILFIGEEEITVYPDKIVQKNNSIASLLFKIKGKQYAIKDIKLASLQETGISLPAMGAIAMLSFLMPNRSTNYSRPIFLDLHNGKMVSINTYLGRRKMEKIVEIVNGLVHK
jgi:hypothetical protein